MYKRLNVTFVLPLRVLELLPYLSRFSPYIVIIRRLTNSEQPYELLYKSNLYDLLVKAGGFLF